MQELKGENVKPSDIGEIGDYKRKDINEQLSLIPPECKWAVAELRPGIDPVGHRYTEIFVTVTYPTRETSPKNAEGNPLRRTIVKVVVMALVDNSAVAYFDRVATGDVLWSNPTPPIDPSILIPPVKLPDFGDPLDKLGPPSNGASSSGGIGSSKPARTAIIPVGDRAQSAKLISSPQPIYPDMARQARVSGTVQFSVIIGEDGHIEQATVVSGHPLLRQAAKDAVIQWVYQPTVLNNQPVKVSSTVDVIFTPQ